MAALWHWELHRNRLIPTEPTDSILEKFSKVPLSHTAISIINNFKKTEIKFKI